MASYQLEPLALITGLAQLEKNACAHYKWRLSAVFHIFHPIQPLLIALALIYLRCSLFKVYLSSVVALAI